MYEFSALKTDESFDHPLHQIFMIFSYILGSFFVLTEIEGKMKRNLLPLVMVAGLLMWQCSGAETDVSLKKSLDTGVERINKAVNQISATKGYELMTLTDISKSGDGYSDSIDLEQISGVYDFTPDTFFCRHFSIPYWKFNKTADSELLVMNMPQKLVFQPRCLFNPDPSEPVAENDFTVTASEYHYYYSFLSRFDYLLKAGFTLKGEDIGTLEVESSGETFAGKSYSSKYMFTDDYSLAVAFTRGDTSISSMALMEGDELLMGEENYFIRNNYRLVERKYVLTIGNIQVVRSSGTDSIEVYLDGVLQKNAAAFIHDENEDGESVCRHRDIELTFDDGTTARLSELMGPALEILRSLSEPMREMYFARRIIDHLAMTVYYRQQ
jgi:hypothetical protein